MAQPPLTPFMDRACKLTFSPEHRSNPQTPLHHILQECLLSNNEADFKTPVRKDSRFQDSSAFFQEMDLNLFDDRLLVSSDDEVFDAYIGYTPNHSRRARDLVERARRLTRYSLDGTKSSPASSITTINSESQDPRLVDLDDFPSDIELAHE